MVKVAALNLPTSAPGLQQLTQPNNPGSPIFPRGVITLINESKLPPTALKEGTNCMLYEDGNPGPRWGTDWYGTALPNGAAIDGANYYAASDGTTHIVAIGGGVVYRSTNNAATWAACTGATPTIGAKATLTQANSFLYITNGVDAIIRYDGSTTLLSYTGILAPTGLSATASAGIAGSTYTTYYRVVAINQIGFTQGSTTATVTTSKTRDQWDPANSGAGYVTLSWTAVTGASRYDIYVTDNATDNTLNNLYYIDSVSSASYVDNGQTFENTNNLVPTQNTSTGPVLGELVPVGTRLYGTRDPNNKYRIWWTGGGPFLGYFADSYNGGYIDIQKGSQFTPVHIADYRDGKGSPLATIWFTSPDGLGCIWQMSLDLAQASDGTQYIQANPAKLPGSRGTNAPFSVVNTLNDYKYYNSQGIYDIGSRANQLNLLSTDEYSINIRPTLQQITPSASPTIAGAYHLGKLFMSVPYGSTANNATIVYDEQISGRPWIPTAYTLGFERFFQYSDTSAQKTLHLLAWKPGDNRLSETSSTIQGDYGQGFATSLISGLNNTTKSRFQWLWCETAYLEFSNPQDAINIELIGISRSAGYSSQKTASIQRTVVNAGWDTYPWDTVPWDYTAVVPVTYSQSSVKKYFKVQKELNAYQFHIYTNSLNAMYILRTLELDGTPTESAAPRAWKL